MLFTTATFVFLYLPIVLAGFFVLGRLGQRAAAAWLLLASLVFYGYWMPVFTLLLLASIAMNFSVGLRIQRCVGAHPAAARQWMWLGVGLNLAVLGYFKYANFFVDNLNALLGTHASLGAIILPIGISFYTFTQIAFLVDACQGKVGEARWVHYGLFVTYFPHLVAGPVLHHAQMMPQFADPSIYRPRLDNLATGLFIFSIGLAKKVVLADGVAPYADAVFGAAETGVMPTAAEAWLGAVAYTLQLYFDFSGYSDMAVGLSWMFNVRLPFNFNSPYRALNISDFWRRWHMTLSAFLRDYLYVPLGGNRQGPRRRALNLMLTMLLGGLWHGASWSFVVWGGLHGAYLMVNHGFRAWLGEARARQWAEVLPWRLACWCLTLLAVVVAWVFFRAPTLHGAGRLLASMAGLQVPDDPGLVLWNAGLAPGVGWLWCGVLGAMALFFPNSNTWGERVRQALGRAPQRGHLVAGAAATGVVLLVLLNSARDSVSAFIYFNF